MAQRDDDDKKTAADLKQKQEEQRKKDREAAEARQKQHDESRSKENEALTEQLERERSGKAGPASVGQGRTKQRLASDAESGGKTKTLRNPQTGDEIEVTETRWKAEGQMLRQQGWESAEALDQADPGGDEGASGEGGSEGGGGA